MEAVPRLQSVLRAVPLASPWHKLPGGCNKADSQTYVLSPLLSGGVAALCFSNWFQLLISAAAATLYRQGSRRVSFVNAALHAMHFTRHSPSLPIGKPLQTAIS
ncbi:hypothetical protein NDU88_005151 [Pleurodeles waltl]|uniref:Uncharacterized protein n=1 Tax=Pleurodeles waltl TaxID=8319 RepID=A0AAV7UH84_PLEWA|nr:hypothetical protein NDU88_005151 [Pleurodeles waltl]